MNPAYISIWMMLIIIFMIIPQQIEKRRIKNRIVKRKRGHKRMTNELVKKYIGCECEIASSGMTGIVGKITETNENWIEVQTKKGYEVVNLDFIQKIKIRNK